MTLALVVLMAGLTAIGTVLGIRVRSGRQFRYGLVTYRLSLPANLTADDVTTWLSMVAASTYTKHRQFRAPVVMVLELVATSQGLTHYLLVLKLSEQGLLSTVRAGLPGTRLEVVAEPVAPTLAACQAMELAISSTRRPLAFERAEAVSTAFLAAQFPLGRGEQVRTVWSITSAGTPQPVIPRTRNAEHSSMPWWLESSAPADADAMRAQRVKERDPLLHVCIRMSSSASSDERAKSLLVRAAASLRGLNAPGVRVTRRRLPSSVVAKRMQHFAVPLTTWPLLLNTRELASLIGFPIGNVNLPGLALHTARQLPPSPGMPRTGIVLARSNYPGMAAPLAMRTKDRLQHLYLLGPTGTGKSTLIANMAIQDAQAGHGLIVVDPKSDLIDDILSRLPEARREDVIVLDPAVLDMPIVGFNLLGGLHTEADRELVVDNVVHIFSSLWADSWGPRTSDVLRNALLTLTHTHAPDGSAFTLVEVAELLTNPSFRRFVTNQAGVPEGVRPFWTTYEQQSEAQRIQIIGPALNKLRALTTRTPLRLMLGQSTGVDLAEVLRQRKILLVKLSKGAVGTDTAQLLGALLVASLWQATLKRASIPQDKRHPAFVYLDEFQDILRLPLDIADMLAQARGLGVGLTLAHQYLGQLSEAVRKSVLGTARSSVIFQLDYDDAKVFERRFAPLTATDISSLPAYEVALRLSVDGQTGRPVTGVTLPLPEATIDADELTAESRAHYGVPRADIEAAIRARITPKKAATSNDKTGSTTAFGRHKVGGGQ
jgi:Type IV secretion-system coupling protein DNA-binding domain